MPGKHAITLQRSSVEPFLQFSSRRDLREKAFRAWLARGDNNDKTDNKAIIAETIALRAERAKLLGYPTLRALPARRRHGEDAGGGARAAGKGLGAGARARARRPRRHAGADRARRAATSSSRRGTGATTPRSCASAAATSTRPRSSRTSQLDRVIEASFYTANKLFGLTFKPVDVPVWHPDVRAWEVRGADGSHVGIFFGDYFARPSKHSGGWMGTLRDQEKLAGDVRPLVLNVMNFNKGDPTLLSFDDARTLFHEMGHALHGLLSNVTYPTISCTSVLTDWVELPSQLYEHWFEQPEVLRQFARHYRTGEPIPEALVQQADGGEELRPGLRHAGIHRLGAGRSRPASAAHRPTGSTSTPSSKKTLERIGMPEEIVMRHRPPHFTHVFSGGYYASAYYSYMWSEVLDADAFAAFEETGDIFNPAVASRLYQNVLSTGGSRDPAELYIAFRGRLPSADALLKKRGFADAAA